MRRDLSSVFLLVTFSLIILGLISVFSASYPQALDFGFVATYFFKRQVIFAVLAILVSVAIYFIPISWIKAMVIPLMLICLALMGLTLFTHFGLSALGARRWLSLGPLPSFQPSEVVKFSTILFLARVLGDEKTSKSKRQIIATVVCLFFAALILLQKDYSTTAVYLGVSLSMLLLSGVSIHWVILGFLFLVPSAIAVLLTEPYRVKRVVAFLFPNLDPSGINYQVSVAKKAIQSGGLFGKGLGKGYYKNGVLPEVQNDFILANMAEEMGFLGLALVFSLFIAFALIGFNASRRLYEKNKFLSYMCFGFTTMIFWQALVNAAVVSGFFPPTGITLPFFSQGGTSLFVIICEAGFLYKIIRESKIEPSRKVVIHKDDYVFPELR